ncbi:hypothetical protein RJ639_024026, partial [Escallonia herrerae]
MEEIMNGLTRKAKAEQEENEDEEDGEEEDHPIQRQVKRKRKATKKQPSNSIWALEFYGRNSVGSCGQTRSGAFKILAENYLDLDSHSSYETIQALLEETQITPAADDFEILTPKTLLGDADACLESLIQSSQDYERRRTEKRMPIIWV